MKKRIAAGLLILFVLLQFFRPEQNRNPGVQPYALSAEYAVPADVQATLTKACLDCHSNNTAYPWYAHVQPIGWWLAGHIREGKQKLNFDEFTAYGLKKQDHKLEEVTEVVKKGSMPLPSYTKLHRPAALSPSEKQALLAWVEKTRKEIQSRMLVAEGKEKRENSARNSNGGSKF